MSGYIGPIPVPQGIQEKQSFTATASQTTFNTNGYTDGAFINVFLNGVRLINGTDYTATNGSDIVLTTGASANDVLDFETFNSFSLVDQTFDNVTLKNPTHEDTDGGRESAVSFKGEQSGGEISTLAQIQASHDGTSDDQKGDLILKTNDGSDNNAPTERMRIDSNGSILTATLGTDNVHIGEGAGVSITSGGNNNVTIGKSAGTALTTGDNNVAVGYQALMTEDADGSSTAIGYRALKVQNAGATSYNTAVGVDAGLSVTTGVNNTLIGGGSGDAITTGGTNTFVGGFSGSSLTEGGNNVAMGYDALLTDTKGSHTVGIGRQALKVQNFTSATDSHNTAVGNNAGMAVTTGTNNTIVGSNVGSTMNTGYDNTFIGVSAGASVTSGYSNTFVGKTSGQLVTGNLNTYLGRYDGNQDGIDIRSGSSYIVFSDGAGNVRQIYWAADGRMYMRQTLNPWVDGSYNLGTASNKWAALHATNGTIQTSDENEKQQIASLTSAEITAATAISKLFKTYKMNSSVKDKGDAARIHSGVIAQHVKTAMNDVGLDETKYGFWCSDTWWTKDREVEAIEANEELGIEAKDAYTFTDRWEKEEDAPEGATKHTVLGIRYDELLAFVCAATEQRLTSIEAENTAIKARLDALEAD